MEFPIPRFLTPPSHAQASTAGLVLREAHHWGILGNTSGYVWILTDAVVNNLGLVLPIMTAENPCLECRGPETKEMFSGIHKENTEKQLESK